MRRKKMYLVFENLGGIFPKSRQRKTKIDEIVFLATFFPILPTTVKKCCQTSLVEVKILPNWQVNSEIPIKVKKRVYCITGKKLTICFLCK